MAWTDFIEKWMEVSDGLSSPDQFRLWAGISLIAGACERRVWARAARAVTFPNLYILLTAAPGIGKQVIAKADKLFRGTKEFPGGPPAFRCAPTQMTKAAMIDAIAESKQVKLVKGANLEYHSMYVAAEEFQVLLPSYDTEFISTLNAVFNNPDIPYEEHRRTGAVRKVSINNPQLNILAGVQPSYFVSTFPEEAWTTGFARRIIMVYASEGKFHDLFQDHQEPEETPGWEELKGQLSQVSNLYGCCQWEPDAADMLAKWHRAKGPPTPSHSKLVHYNNSRTMFVIKLGIISAVARTGGMVINCFDVTRALSWLLNAEKLMPDVFREMIGKSDTQVIDELHYMMVMEQAKQRKALSTAVVWEFLRQRVPSEKIEKILYSALKSGVLCNPGGAPDLWEARPITGVRGVE